MGNIPRSVIGKLARPYHVASELCNIFFNASRFIPAGVLFICVRLAGLSTVHSGQAFKVVIVELQLIADFIPHSDQESFCISCRSLIVCVFSPMGFPVNSPVLVFDLPSKVVTLAGGQDLLTVLQNRAFCQPVQTVIQILNGPTVAVRHTAQAAVLIIAVGSRLAIRCRPGSHPVPVVIGEGHGSPVAIGLLGQVAVANGILVLGQRPAAHLQLRHPSEGVVDEAVILGSAAGPAAQFGQLSFGISIYHPGAICKRSMLDSAKRIVGVISGVSQSVCDALWQCQHFAQFAGIAVLYRCPSIVGHGEQPVAIGIVLGTAGHGQAAAFEGGIGHVALGGVRHVLGHMTVGHRSQIVLAVVFISVSAISAGHGLDFQAQAILIIIVAGILAAVLQKIVFGAVTVGIAQVLSAANDLRCQRLHTVQRPAGAEIHCRAMRQIGRGAVDKIVRVINQVYGERIRRGGVGCHFFDDLQLAGGVCQIGRTGVACAHGVVGVVMVLDGFFSEGLAVLRPIVIAKPC